MKEELIFALYYVIVLIELLPDFLQQSDTALFVDGVIHPFQ